MRLDFVEVKELAEKIRGRKAKTALKVSGENYVLSGFRRGFHLAARNPARYLFRYPPGAVQPINFRLLYVGTFPGSAGDRTGSLAGAACLLASSGSGLWSRRRDVHPGKLCLEPVGSLAVMTVAGRFGKICFGGHTGQKLPKSTYKQISQDLALREDLRVREKPKEKGKVNPLPAQELEVKKKKA